MTQAKILIVEDEPVLAQSTRAVLRSLGYKVVGIARSGSEAIRQAGELQPSVVLMDIKLEGEVDGIEAAGQIRTRFGIPVIYLTAYADDRALYRAQSTAPFGYLLKPFRPEELRGVIELALQRHQMERRLAESERRYRLLAENATDVISRHAPDGTYLYVSPACRGLLGCEPEELLGRSAYAFLHSQDEDILRAVFRDISTETIARTVQYRIRRRDGNCVWVEANARTVGDAGTGQEQEIVAITRDISERKQAEEALSASRDSLARAQRIGHLGSWDWNVEKGSLTWSDELYRIFGVDKGHFKLIFEGIEAMIHPDDRAKNASMVGQVLATGDGCSYEFRIVRPDGETRHIYQSVEVECNGERNVTRAFGIMQDITERKQAEAQKEVALEALRDALQRMERRQQALLVLSDAAQGVQRARTPQQVYQAIGDEIGKLGYGATILGLTEDRLRLETAHIGLSPKVIRAAEKLTGLSASGYSFPLTPGSFYERLVREGRAVFTDSGAAPIAEALPEPARPLAKHLADLLGLEKAIYAPLFMDDHVHSILTVMGADLTADDVPAVMAFASQTAIALDNALLLDQLQRHRDSLQRLSAQILHAQEEERGRISRELHDEMGQALTAMSINLAEIERASATLLSAASRERLAETRLLADQTLDEVRDLSLSLRPSLLDDLGLVPALHWYLGQAGKRLNIELQFEAVGLETRLPGDVETNLYRVVQEALTNVARHANAQRVAVRVECTASCVLVTIEDDGRGFDPDRPDRADAPDGAGLLGMRERVAHLGGQFDLCSRPGRGTVLSLEIPL